MPHTHDRLIGVVVAVTLAAGCTAGAYARGERAARIGDWDAAVEHYRRALQEDPRRADYRIALVRAKLNASRRHIDAARRLEAHDELPAALVQYEKASEYDPSNGYTLDRLAAVERAIRDRSKPRPDAPARREEPPPLLDPVSREPLRIRFVDASLKDILDFIGNVTGINVIYDAEFEDRTYSVQLDGVTLRRPSTWFSWPTGTSTRFLASAPLASPVRDRDLDGDNPPTQHLKP